MLSIHFWTLILIAPTMTSMDGDYDDTYSTPEPPFSDFDPFGIRQIMLPIVSFHSSAKVNAHRDNGRDTCRGSRSRRALKNKVQASSFARHQAYWERSSCTSNLYLRKRESPAPELSLSSSWEDIDFDDDDSALFAPDIENSSTISDDVASLSWPSPLDKSFETEPKVCHQDDKANRRRPGSLDEGVISLRVHRAYSRTKADEVKKPIGGDNAPAVETHEFLLVRKKLNRIKGCQVSETKERDKRHIGPRDINKAAKFIIVDEGNGPNLASKATSFDVLPLNLTDLTSPESLDADSCRSTENEASTDDLPTEIPNKSNHVDIAYDSPGDVSLETGKIVTANDPHYEKYHRMLKVGLPLPAVIHACERDGVDPTFLQRNRPSHHPPSTSKGSEMQQQDSHRRTRLHWKILPRVGKNSVWALLDRETDELDNLRIDPAEFSELFEAKKEDSGMSDTKQTFRDRSLQPLIDPKRNKNGSILLSALKRDPVDLARDVDEMNDLKLDAEQIAALSEYIPSKQEKIALSPYIDGQAGPESITTSSRVMSGCEKWMIAISSVQDAGEKLRSMRFIAECPKMLEHLQSDANLLERACTQIKNSVRLRKLLGIILSLGNRLNTAGEGRDNRVVAGIPLSALLELENVKAYDSAKTSFLQYVVTVIQRNHPDLLPGLSAELDCVPLAKRIQYAQWQEQIRTTNEQLESLKQVALRQARTKSNFDDEVLLLRFSKIGMLVVRSSKILDNLREKAELLSMLFNDLVSYFVAPMQSSSDIIGTIAALIQSIERARKGGDKACVGVKHNCCETKSRIHVRVKMDKNNLAGPKLEQMLRESNLFLTSSSKR